MKCDNCDNPATMHTMRNQTARSPIRICATSAFETNTCIILSTMTHAYGVVRN